MKTKDPSGDRFFGSKLGRFAYHEGQQKILEKLPEKEKYSRDYRNKNDCINGVPYNDIHDWARRL